MNYENGKLKQHTQPKWFRNLITLVISFTMVVGIFGGMKLDVEAANYTLNLASPESKSDFMRDIFTPGDIITINVKDTTYTSVMYYFQAESGGEIIASEHLMFLSNNNEKSLTIPNKDASLKWQCNQLNTENTATAYLLFLPVNDSSSEQPTDNPQPASAPAPSTPSHECSFQWVTTVEPQPDADGLEQYKCTGCGAVQEQKPIPASVASVQNLCGFVYNAPQNGTVTTDFGRLHTISDYILKKMAERSDVTSIIQFEYKNQKLQIIFPAGTDYSPVLNDDDMMYGFYGIAPRLGLSVTER